MTDRARPTRRGCRHRPRGASPFREDPLDALHDAQHIPLNHLRREAKDAVPEARERGVPRVGAAPWRA